MTRQCKVSGCSKPARRWGMCNTHSTRWFSHGDVHKVLKSGRKPKHRGLFMSEWVRAILPYDGDDCLTWPYATDKDGYGLGELGGKIRRAHRYICMLAHGAPPTQRHQAAHSCGKGHLGCVNPRHLRWATNSENQLDRWAHARANDSESLPERERAA